MSPAEAMNAPVLIVGQGLAGTALALELESAGVPLVIADPGAGDAASRVAAGLINPITGQRFVKSWRIDELLPQARAAYARWGTQLGVPLWHDLKFERRLGNDTERARVARKLASGELAPYATPAGVDRIMIHHAARVDLPALLDAARRRWVDDGRLRSASVTADELTEAPDGVRWRGELFRAVVISTGASRLGRELLASTALTPIKGQILTLRGPGLAENRAVHGGVWVIGEAAGIGRAGATFERGVEDREITVAARESLLAAARAVVEGELVMTGQAAGVRLAADDQRPVAGWHPLRPRIGFFGALGSKGALWAPWLAAQWRDEFQQGGGFAAEVLAARIL